MKKQKPAGKRAGDRLAAGHGSKSNPKSTASEAQRERILSALSTGPKTSYDLRRLGCYQCPARVLELRRRGYDIRTDLVTIYDRDGYRHDRVALYSIGGGK
ncbi:helix-turn-helix domain-containing protein [Bordetella bronchialis]|uniref:helix-turn-helix domain-containing protein n=1 Tax=Bordetella bronchialis TaxID=463025 RepID=UPI003D082C2D